MIEIRKNKILGLLILFFIGIGICLNHLSDSKPINVDPILTKWTNDNLVVLLTMTINTTVNGPRRKLSNRIGDYRKSVKQWVKLPYKVVIAENSGYPNPFQDILENAPHIQYFSTYIPYDSNRGIGYAEGQTLKYAIENIIKDDSIYIIKMTGRYAPLEGLSDVVRILMSKKPAAIIKESIGRGTWFKRSEWFVAKRAFYQELIDNCMKTCNDLEGWDYSIESQVHHLGDRTENVIKTDLEIKIIKTRTGSLNTLMTSI